MVRSEISNTVLIEAFLGDEHRSQPEQILEKHEGVVVELDHAEVERIAVVVSVDLAPHGELLTGRERVHQDGPLVEAYIVRSHQWFPA